MKRYLLLLTAILAAPSLMHADKNFIRFPALKLGNEPRSSDASALRVGYRYEQSTHARALGSYFGPQGRANFWLGGEVDGDLGFPSNVPLGYLLTGNTHSAINVVLDPVRVTHGVVLEGSLAEHDSGWSLDCAVYLQEVKQALRPQFRAGVLGAAADLDNARQYLMGEYSKQPTAAPSTGQDALRYQRFYEGWQSVGGADRLSLSVNKKCTIDGLVGLSLQAGADLPLHRQREYSYLFQPDFQTMTPHLWLGASGHYAAELSPNLGLQLSCALRAGYFLPFEQTRTFSTYGQPFSPYRLLGFEGQVEDTIGLIPAANVLTIPSRIKQGVATKLLIAGELQVHQAVLLGASYSFNAASAETVRPLQQPLKSINYGYAGETPFLLGNFGTADTDFASLRGRDWIRPSGLDLNSPAVPGCGAQEFTAYIGHQLLREHGGSLSWRAGGSYRYAQAFLAQNSFAFFATMSLSF